MRDLSRVTGLAMLLIVVVRLSIGWQFLYEGLWKIDSLSSARPWTAEGYLKNAQGPFRDHFRSMVEDPDDLNWLDAEKVNERLEAQYEAAKEHYALTDEQLNGRPGEKGLKRKMYGLPTYAAVLAELPPQIKLSNDSTKSLSFDPKRKRLVVSGETHLTPRDKRVWLSKAPVLENPTAEQEAVNELNKEFRKALETVYQRQTELGYTERVRAILLGDPDIAGVYNEAYEGTVDERWLGEIDKYKVKLESYEETLANAETEFEFDHAQQKADELRGLRTTLVGPIKAIDAELLDSIEKSLTAEQLAMGPPPPLPNPIHRIDKMTIAALTCLGLLLICGLFTRLAAIAGAVMLLNFYLVLPPWPGVPQPPGPEHALFINKNMIEIFALIMIAALPTGQWFGLDRLIRWGLKCCRKSTASVG